MHAFEVIADPVRRRILEVLATGQRASGEIVAIIQAEFRISQPAVSQHLKVLRDSGFAVVRVDAQRRLYSLAPAPLQDVERWLDRFRAFWDHKLDALDTEIARGKRQRRRTAPRPAETDKQRKTR